MYFWQCELPSSIKSFYFGCAYLWQRKVIELLSIQCASVALIFGNTKSLSSFVSFVYLEIKMDASGALRPLTSFHLINHVFADIGEPFDAIKCPFRLMR
jgi:hypothetical protein